jgi:hypothetical protein
MAKLSSFSREMADAQAQHGVIVDQQDADGSHGLCLGLG